MLKAIHKGDYVEAANQMKYTDPPAGCEGDAACGKQSDYYSQVGDRAKRNYVTLGQGCEGKDMWQELPTGTLGAAQAVEEKEEEESFFGWLSDGIEARGAAARTRDARTTKHTPRRRDAPVAPPD